MLTLFKKTLKSVFHYPRPFTVNEVTSYKILECTDSTVNDKFRKLVKINHPDVGGSDFICGKISEARKYIREYKRTI